MDVAHGQIVDGDIPLLLLPWALFENVNHSSTTITKHRRVNKTLHDVALVRFKCRKSTW
ncbi:hypothetical protein [Paenibacillus tundrae]|uniref:Uncharacterized protein n=1 Tax=Paenibacillus tundrae TaxID=528187 RepID=A0ABT9WBD4_9BACL|nr:hypothetical protein [Paenibacillus tundrae]MDQ0170576.1 hypothetical protein [Paenibacillus tundrae]